MDDDEETIVINDLLSFLSCKYKAWTFETLLEEVKKFYPDEEIIQAYSTLRESIQDSYELSEKVDSSQEALEAIHSCFLNFNKNELPVFVCRNLENVPDLTIVKSEKPNQTDQSELEKFLYDNNLAMKGKIAEVVSTVNGLSEQLRQFATKVTSLAGKHREARGNSISKSSRHCIKGQRNPKRQKLGLAYLQKLIDEEDKISQPPKKLSSTEEPGIFKEELLSEDEEELTGTVIDTQKLRATSKFSLGNTPITKSIIQRNSFPSKTICENVKKSSHKKGRRASDLASQKVLHIKSENESTELMLVKSEPADDEKNDFNLSDLLYTEDSNQSIEDTSEIHLTDPSAFLLPNERGKNRKSLEGYPEEELALHLNRYNGKQCPLCLQEFRKKGELTLHMDQCPAISIKEDEVTSSEKFECPTCGVFVATLQSLMSHKAYHDPNRKHECNICKYRFYSKEALEKHTKVHSDGLFQCPYCVYASERKSKLVTHIRIHTGFKPYECHLCDYRAISNYALVYHIQRHNENRGAFQCDLCGVKFKTKQRLTIHKLVHNDRRRFVCDTCSKSFKSSSAFKRHISTHSSVKPFACSICNYRARDTGALQNHINIHSIERPYKCPVCPFRANQKGYLANHLKSYHIEQEETSIAIDYMK